MAAFPSKRRKRAFKIQRQVNYSYGSYGFVEPIAAVPSDDTPAQFTFTDVTGQQLSSTITSNTITVSDITVEVAVTITGGTYSKNGGAYTGSAGVAVNGDQFSVRVTSSASQATAASAVLTIGGVSDTFTATTGSETETTTFTDTLVRANENMSANANWTQIAGVATTLQIASNLVFGTNSNNACAACPDVGTVNSFTSCAWRIVSASRGYMYTHMTDANNGILVSYNGTTAYLATTFVAGVPNNRITATIAYSAGQIVKLRRFGNVIKLYVNGTQLGGDYTLTAGEITALAGTRCGFRNGGTSASFAGGTFTHGTVTIA